LVTASGHKFILKDDDGDQEVVLAHKDGQAVNLKNDQSLELIANGHSLTISTNSIVVKHQSGTQVELTSTNVDVQAGASVNLKAPRVVLDGDVSVELGANATDPVIKGGGLIAYLTKDLIWKSTHVHGPPGTPPVAPPPPFNPAGLLSRLVRTK
jgi:phage baseplate assembly protein gpV